MSATTWLSSVAAGDDSPRRTDAQARALLERSSSAWPAHVSKHPAGPELMVAAMLLSGPCPAYLLEHASDEPGRVTRLWTNTYGRALLNIGELPERDAGEITRILAALEVDAADLLPPSGSVSAAGLLSTPIGNFIVTSASGLTLLLIDAEYVPLNIWPDALPGSGWRTQRDHPGYLGVMPIEHDWRKRTFAMGPADLPSLGAMFDVLNVLVPPVALHANAGPDGATTVVAASLGYEILAGRGTDELCGLVEESMPWSDDEDALVAIAAQDEGHGYDDSIGVMRAIIAGNVTTLARHLAVDHLTNTWILGDAAANAAAADAAGTTGRMTERRHSPRGVPVVTLDVHDTERPVVAGANSIANASGMLPMTGTLDAEVFWAPIRAALPDALLGLGTIVRSQAGDATVTVYLNKVAENRIEVAWLSRGGVAAQPTAEAHRSARAILNNYGTVLSVNDEFVKALGLQGDSPVGEKLSASLPGDPLLSVIDELMSKATLSGSAEELVVLTARRPEQTTERNWALLASSWLQPDDTAPAGRVAIDIADLGPVETTPHHLLLRDQLTGLHGRTALHAMLRADIAGLYDGVAYLDVYGFKAINDHYGTTVGDRCLNAIAGRLTALSGPDDLVVRASADEFVVLSTSIDTLVASVERLGWPEVLVDGATVPIRLRLGWSALGDHRTLAEAARAADLALTAAKRSSSSSVQRHVPEMAESLARRAEQEQQLRRSINGDSLRTAYQPIVDVDAQNAPIGFEALLRVGHPVPVGQAALVGPEELIAAAERLGLAGRFYDQASATAIRGAWNVLEGNEAAVWLNFSRSQLVDPTLVDRLLLALKEARIEPGRVVLEVTEHVVDEPTRRVAITLSALKKHGVRIAVDDFGKGASNLVALQELDVDVVKLDKSLLPIEDDDPRWRLLEAVNRMLTSLDLLVVAEGVEEASQAARLKAMGIHLQQGFLHGRPTIPDAG